MTYFEKIKAMTLHELAEFNVHESYEYYADYDWYSERTIEYHEIGYRTSDGSFFDHKEDAVEYEAEWLDQEVKE